MNTEARDDQSTCWPSKTRQRHASNKVDAQPMPFTSNPSHQDHPPSITNKISKSLQCDHMSKADFDRVRDMLKKGPYHKSASNGANLPSRPTSWLLSQGPFESCATGHKQNTVPEVLTNPRRINFPGPHKVINFGPNPRTEHPQPQAGPVAGILNIGDCQIRVSSSAVHNITTPDFDNYDTLDTFEACRLNLVDISRLAAKKDLVERTATPTTLNAGIPGNNHNNNNNTTSNDTSYSTLNGNVSGTRPVDRSLRSVVYDLEQDALGIFPHPQEPPKLANPNFGTVPEQLEVVLAAPSTRGFVSQLMSRLGSGKRKWDLNLKKQYVRSYDQGQGSGSLQIEESGGGYLKFDTDDASKETSPDAMDHVCDDASPTFPLRDSPTEINRLVALEARFDYELVDQIDCRATEPLGPKCASPWPPVYYEPPGDKELIAAPGALTLADQPPAKAPLVFKRVRKRLVNKYGSTNVVQSNISNRKQHFLSDIYTTMLDSRWRWSVLIFALGFLLSWTLFSVVWWLICFSHGDFEHASDPAWRPCFKNAQTFTSAFLFSIETQHTIGYGYRHITEECPEGVLLFVIQSIAGAMIQGFVIGLIFSKLSRPKKRAVTLMFSRTAVVCTRDGEPCLLVRIGDMRRSHIIDARTRAYLFRKKVTLEGEVIPLHPHHMPLCFDPSVGPANTDRIFLAWPSILVHRIDGHSPLYNLGARELAEEKFEIVVILEGMIEASGMSMQARTSYLPHEIAWGHRFQKLITFVREDGDYNVDYSAFHHTVPFNMPLCSARELDLLRSKYREAHAKRLLGSCSRNQSHPERNDDISALVNRLELLLRDLKSYADLGERDSSGSPEESPKDR